MKNNWWLFGIMVVSMLFGIAGIIALIASNRMNRSGGMMMGWHEMKGMMSQMMGNVLPPVIAPQSLPDSNSQGAKLLSHYCIQCHNLPSPAMHSAKEWPAIANRMFSREAMMSDMINMMRIQNPSAGERQVIIAYLQTHALKAVSSDTLPNPDSRGAILFRAICSQCHALPDPKLHTATEWPSVVERMRENLTIMKNSTISKKDIQAIEKYLMSHAVK